MANQSVRDALVPSFKPVCGEWLPSVLSKIKKAPGMTLVEIAVESLAEAGVQFHAKKFAPRTDRLEADVEISTRVALNPSCRLCTIWDQQHKRGSQLVRLEQRSPLRPLEPAPSRLTPSCGS